MSSFPVLRTRLSVCFLSPFPDSLPQLFLRCLPCALAFGLFPFDLLSFVRFSSGSGYLASVSSFPLSSRLCLTVASSVLPLYLSASLLFPVLSDLISHVFFLGSSYSAFCLFPFILLGFAPTAVPPMLPFFSASSRPLLFWAVCLLSGFFRPLPPASDYSAFRSFFSLLPVLPCRRFLRCCLSTFRLPCFSSFRPACFHAFLPIPVLSFLQILSPFTVSPHSGYLSALAFFLSVPASSPWLSL